MHNDSETNKLPDRKVIRFQGYDYSLAGYYFITIVIQDRLCLLGSIENETWQPSAAGTAIEKALAQIPEAHQDVTIPHYVVMPNHIHAIIGLSKGVSLN